MLEIYVPQHQYSPNAGQSIASQRLSSSTASAGQQQDGEMVMSSLIQRVIRASCGPGGREGSSDSATQETC